jgi:hypothetical protein
MLRTNAQNLVEKSVIGTISRPRLNLKNPYLVDSSGQACILPGTGGITYNVSIGDSALDFMGDHIEPGVSIASNEKGQDEGERGGLSILTCIGNEARVVSGPAAGSKGIVTGKHGGVEHVIIDFPPSILDKLSIGNRIQVRAFGQGLVLKDFADVHVMSVDPKLLQKMGITQQNKQLVVPVTHVIPASLMGSGIGSRHSYSGDYDIQLADKESVQKYGLQSLRLGDVIAIRDADCRFGRSYRDEAVTIGIVVHGACITSGHGPGVTVIMTTARKLIVPKIEENANIGLYLELRRARRRTGTRRRRSHS